MSLNDYFNLSLRRVFRNKKNISYIIICVICSTLVLIALTFYSNILNYVDSEINKNISSRSLIVPPDLNQKDMGKDELSKINHVVTLYDSKYSTISSSSSNLKSDYTDGNIGLVYGSLLIQPTIVAGRGFLETDKNVAICPINFYPDTSAYNLNVSKNGLLNGNDLIGENIIVNYTNDSSDTLDESFKVIGVYDNKSVMRFNNECYVLSDDIKKIVDFVNPTEEGEISGTIVIVDSMDNLEYVKEQIMNIPDFLSTDYELQTSSIIDMNSVHLVTISCLLVVLVILVVSIVLTISYTKKKLLNESKIIGVLRNSGYDKQTISTLYYLEILIVNLFSYILGLIIFLISLFILTKYLYVGLSYSIIDIKISMFSIVFALAIILIPSIVVIFYINEKCNKNITDLIGKED